MKVIAVDVDLTVVDTLNPWLKWVEKYTGGRKVRNESGQYDLVPEMKELLEAADNGHINPFSFWKDDCLYRDLQPLPGSLSALHSLSRQSHIVFVSSCVPEHTRSKELFLKKWFPFAEGFISTTEKHFVGYDILIDDKIEHLQLGKIQRPNAQHLLFTGVRADGTSKTREAYELLSDWGDIHSKLGF